MNIKRARAIEDVLVRTGNTVDIGASKLLVLAKDNGYTGMDKSKLFAQMMPAITKHYREGSSVKIMRANFVNNILDGIFPESGNDRPKFKSLLNDIFEASYESITTVTSSMDTLRVMTKEELLSLFNQVKDQHTIAAIIIQSYQQEYGRFPLNLSEFNESIKREKSTKGGERAADIILSFPPEKHVEIILAMPMAKTYGSENEARLFLHSFLKEMSTEADLVAEVFNIKKASPEKIQEVFNVVSKAIISSGMDQREVSDHLLEMVKEGARGQELLSYLQNREGSQIISALKDDTIDQDSIIKPS